MSSLVGINAAISLTPAPTLRRKPTISPPGARMMSSERPVCRQRNEETSWRDRAAGGAGAQGLPGRSKQRDILDWRGSKTAWRIAATAAGSHAERPLCHRVERGTCLIEAGLGEGHGPPCADADFRLRSPVDKSAEPEVERNQGSAGQQHTNSDRNNIPARKRAHDRPLDGPEPATPAGVR